MAWAARCRGKLSELSAAWLGSPSLLLVCLAGGVRDAGGFVFGYYLAGYFSPLMDGNAALTGFGSDPCSFSFDPDYVGEQARCRCHLWCGGVLLLVCPVARAFSRVYCLILCTTFLLY